MESSGPEGGKVRGPAAMIHERYLQLARDAASSGDRVLSENYLQHADHYFRLWRSIQPVAPPQQQLNDRFDDGPEGEDEAAGDIESAADAEFGAEGEQPDQDYPQSERAPQPDRDGDNRRRRGRRNRYRPNEGEAGEQREPREANEREGGEAREERRERRDRQPRERDEAGGPEGFSSGPKPAFLRGD